MTVNIFFPVNGPTVPIAAGGFITAPGLKLTCRLMGIPLSLSEAAEIPVPYSRIRSRRIRFPMMICAPLSSAVIRLKNRRLFRLQLPELPTRAENQLYLRRGHRLLPRVRLFPEERIIFLSFPLLPRLDPAFPGWNLSLFGRILKFVLCGICSVRNWLNRQERRGGWKDSIAEDRPWIPLPESGGVRLPVFCL